MHEKAKWVAAIEARIYRLYGEAKALAPRNRAERRSRRNLQEGLRLEARINENQRVLSTLTAGDADETCE